MSKKNKEPKIIHILADGTRVQSMKGREVPLNDRTRRAYEIVAESNKSYININSNLPKTE